MEHLDLVLIDIAPYTFMWHIVDTRYEPHEPDHVVLNTRLPDWRLEDALVIYERHLTDDLRNRKQQTD